MSSDDSNITAVLEGAANATQHAKPHIFALAMLVKPDFLRLEAQVIFSALTIIWLGAHASIRRPPSAAPAETKTSGSRKGKKPTKDDQFTEGFTPSDAIMLPILAGTVLIGLYYLIEWLQDPDVLNKILRVYMSVMAVASLSRLSADALNILTSFVFPNVWADRRGNLVHIDPEARRQIYLGENGEETPIQGSNNPFPGFLATRSLPTRLANIAWEIRHLLTEEWTVRLAAHGFGALKFDLKLNSLLGVVVALLVSIAYHLTGWHMVSNLLGSAFAYTAFSLMSPTSFGIGTSVLVGLFIYDIVMVFYTPFMITVAKKVDAPIKLVFQGTSGLSMLGLGDIIVPGLLMGLALRFDMYRFYQSKIKLEPVELASEAASGVAGKTVKTTVTQYRQIKAPYVDPQGQWGDRFWTTKLGSLYPVPGAASVRAATAFPKPYFYATIIGYAVGMLVTLTMLLVFNHGQPALLYLVPGVAGSVWLTALVRGELKEMWNYTEDGSLDTKDVVVEVDGSGKVINETGTPIEKDAETASPHPDEKTAAAKKKAEAEGDYAVFLFSITAPRHSVSKLD